MKKLTRALAFVLALTLGLSMLFSVAAKADSDALKKAVKGASAYIMKNYRAKEGFTYGDEWFILAFSRSGNDGVAASTIKTYAKNAGRHIAKALEGQGLTRNDYSDYAKAALGLVAAGYDPRDVGGHDLVGYLSEMENVNKQGVNSAAWTLLMLDAGGWYKKSAETAKTVYPWPKGGDVTRFKLIESILIEWKQADKTSGGWDYSYKAKTPDPDMTAMVLWAFSPYYGKNWGVDKYVDQALAWLSGAQQPDGGYSSWDTTNCESIACVLTALAVLGIDPLEDERFIKNGNTLLDALFSFRQANGSFKHLKTGKTDKSATAQALYALTAVERLWGKKSPLFAMSDIKLAALDLS